MACFLSFTREACDNINLLSQPSSGVTYKRDSYQYQLFNTSFFWCPLQKMLAIISPCYRVVLFFFTEKIRQYQLIIASFFWCLLQNSFAMKPTCYRELLLLSFTKGICDELKLLTRVYFAVRSEVLNNINWLSRASSVVLYRRISR